MSPLFNAMTSLLLVDNFYVWSSFFLIFQILLTFNSNKYGKNRTYV
jgi:hypothetical protein